MVIIAETGIFFLLVPSGEDVAALAEARLIESIKEKEHEEKADAGGEGGGHGGGGHGAKAEKGGSKDGNKVVEFPLGKFGTNFVPIGGDGRSYRVEFILFGTVKQKNLDKLKELFTERSGRFRSRLMLEIRNATLSELAENQLGLLQRRILATSTEVFAEDLLLSIGFEEYQLIEE